LRSAKKSKNGSDQLILGLEQVPVRGRRLPAGRPGDIYVRAAYRLVEVHFAHRR